MAVVAFTSGYVRSQPRTSTSALSAVHAEHADAPLVHIYVRLCCLQVRVQQRHRVRAVTNELLQQGEPSGNYKADSRQQFVLDGLTRFPRHHCWSLHHAEQRLAVLDIEDRRRASGTPLQLARCRCLQGLRALDCARVWDYQHQRLRGHLPPPPASTAALEIPSAPAPAPGTRMGCSSTTRTTCTGT